MFEYLKNLKLNNPKSLELVKQLAEDILVFHKRLEAYFLLNRLEDNLFHVKQKNFIHSELYNDYILLLDELYWMALIYLKDEKVTNLFKGKFTVTFKMDDFDVWEELKTRLITTIDYSQRDVLKDKIKRSLENNQEKLTNKNLMKGKEEIFPSVENWLKDYVSNARGDSKLKKAQYLSSNTNITRLSDEDKTRVKTLVELYDKLKISSMTPQGILESINIEDDQRQGVISEGEFTKFDPSLIKEIRAAQAIIDEVYGSEKQENNMLEIGELGNKKTGEQGNWKLETGNKEIKKLETEKATPTPPSRSKFGTGSLKGGGNELPSPGPSAGGGNVKTTKQLMQEVLIGDPKKAEEINSRNQEIKKTKKQDEIIQEIGEVAEKKDEITVVAGLRILAEQGSGGLAKLLTPLIRVETGGLTPSNFRKLLKNILARQLGLPEPEQARYAMQLAIILKKQGEAEFMRAVYFDKGSKQFRWNET